MKHKKRWQEWIPWAITVFTFLLALGDRLLITARIEERQRALEKAQDGIAADTKWLRDNFIELAKSYQSSLIH